MWLAQEKGDGEPATRPLRAMPVAMSMENRTQLGRSQAESKSSGWGIRGKSRDAADYRVQKESRGQLPGYCNDPWGLSHEGSGEVVRIVYLDAH